MGAHIDQDDVEDGFTLDRKQTIWAASRVSTSAPQDIADALLFGVIGGLARLSISMST